MRLPQRLAATFLILIYAAALGAGWLAPAGYAKQFRENPGASPSPRFLLGTDELGRDAFARLLYGSRVSLSLAPAAAFVSTLIAAALGISAGYFGGWVDTFLMRLTDLFLSVPWLFLILTVRAVLPLNVSPFESVGITFLLLGMLGWASAARVVRSTALSLEARDFMIQARARGCGHWRLLAVHLLPNLRPVVAAQFWMSIPIFILSEANLGFLGLGVAEPLPSWGSLLSGLQSLDTLAAGPWRLAPLALLVLVMTCFHLVVPMDDFSK